jgi:hypothetical protein
MQAGLRRVLMKAIGFRRREQIAFLESAVTIPAIQHALEVHIEKVSRLHQNSVLSIKRTMAARIRFLRPAGSRLFGGPLFIYPR